MFFNIYNLIVFFLSFFFKFFFFLKYLTPFFFNKIELLLNSNKNTPTNTNKNSIKNLNLSSIGSYNIFYKSILNSSIDLSSIFVNFYTFKKIIIQNNKSMDINSFLYTLTYIILRSRNFSNVQLVTSNNFFNYQRVNLLINNLNVTSRSSSMAKTYIERINTKLVGLKQTITISPKVLFNSLFKNWLIKFNSTSIDRLLNLNQFYNILFIRNFKVFNKGRYSRNRQYYRTGVYWCLYVNIVAVVGMYYWFYRFTMNFGYLWWLFYFFILTFFFSKFIKFSYTLSMRLELLSIITWLGHLINNTYVYLSIRFSTFFIFFLKNNLYSFASTQYKKLNSNLIYIYLFIVRLA